MQILNLKIEVGKKQILRRIQTKQNESAKQILRKYTITKESEKEYLYLN